MKKNRGRLESVPDAQAAGKWFDGETARLLARGAAAADW
jgi:hypothetical protein